MPTINSINSNIPIEVSKGGTGVTSIPSFSASKSASSLNVTGNGAVYAYICDVAEFNVGSGYNTGTGVFTAPITGKYFFGTRVLIQGCSSTNVCQISFVTTSQSYVTNFARPSSSADFAYQFVQLASMTAGDTCYPTVAASGEAGDTDDVYGGAAPFWTAFYGYYVGP